MKKMFELTSEGDGERSFFVPGKGGKDRILHVGCNDDVLRANAEDRKEDGFDVTRSFRRVAHIDLGTVRLRGMIAGWFPQRRFLRWIALRCTWR